MVVQSDQARRHPAFRERRVEVAVGEESGEAEAAAGQAPDHDLAVGLDDHPAGEVLIVAGEAAAEVEGDELRARAAIERRVDGAVRVEPDDREIPVAEGADGGADDDELAVGLPRDAPVGGVHAAHRLEPELGRAAGGEGGVERGEQVAALERVEVDRPLAIGTARTPSLGCRL